jgi:hypothetical protein
VGEVSPNAILHPHPDPPRQGGGRFPCNDCSIPKIELKSAQLSPVGGQPLLLRTITLQASSAKAALAAAAGRTGA